MRVAACLGGVLSFLVFVSVQNLANAIEVAGPSERIDEVQTEQPVTPSEPTNVTVNLDPEEIKIVPTSGRPLEDIVVELKEKIYNPADGQFTEWYNVPVKVSSYGLTKAQYEIPNMVTSFFTESVTRSPEHNLIAFLDETVQAFVKAKNGITDFFMGFFNPTHAGMVDGALTIGDLGFSGARMGLDAAKTVISLIGYPVFRAFGGKPSEVAPPLDGKRAAIVVIDSAVPLLNYFLDPYGDQIIRYHLKGVVDYYCAYSLGGVEGDLTACLEKIPHDVEKIDLIALTHTGGSYTIEGVANRLKVLRPNATPGLMISIGCGDHRPTMGKEEDSMGIVPGINWAVHFYLSNALAKRLRGIPLDVAAKQAYYEGIVFPNSENPISLLAILAIGYKESYPAVAPMLPQQQN
jgi:hypothetical protein